MDFGWRYLKMAQISTFCRTFLTNLKVCEGILLLKKSVSSNEKITTILLEATITFFR